MRQTYTIQLEDTEVTAERLSVRELLELSDAFDTVSGLAGAEDAGPGELEDGIAAAVRVVSRALSLDPEEVRGRFTPEQVGAVLAEVLRREFGGGERG